MHVDFVLEENQKCGAAIHQWDDAVSVPRIGDSIWLTRVPGETAFRYRVVDLVWVGSRLAMCVVSRSQGSARRGRSFWRWPPGS